MASNSKLISFDVCNLFPSIPLTDVEKQLRVAKLTNPRVKFEILGLLEVCLNQNISYPMTFFSVAMKV